MKLHINATHPGQQIRYICIEDPVSSQLLKDKIRLSKNSSISAQPRTAAKEIKTEVITIDDEEEYKSPSTSVIDHATQQSTNEVTHSTNQTLAVGETKGLKDNHPPVNSVLSQECENSGVDGDNKQLNRAAPPVNAQLEEQEIKPRNEDDDSGDDFEPEIPPPPTSGASQSQQPDVGHQSPLKSPKANLGQEHVKIKPEPIVDDDPDDDFVPDPPANNNGDSQSQQPDVGHFSAADAKDVIDSEAGENSSSEQHSSIDGPKRGKLKRKVKGKTGRNTRDNEGKTKKFAPKSKNGGYGVTCKRQCSTRYQHLEPKLSAPVFKCTKCNHQAKSNMGKWSHIHTKGCRGAKMIRIRSRRDVEAEMQQLKQTHFGVVPRELPYKCTKCKRVEEYECPVCGWSSHWGAVKTHIQQKHRSCNTQPMNSATKYKNQISEKKKDTCGVELSLDFGSQSSCWAAERSDTTLDTLDTMPSCGGFVCTKNALTALNSLYIGVSILLIVVGAYAKGASIVTSISVVAGIIATGVFLLLVSIVGLFGAAKHHQVVLFFYMIILFLVFLVQFFIAVACLAMNEEQTRNLVSAGWVASSNSTRFDAEHTFVCCGLENENDSPYNCDKLPVNHTNGCLDKITKESNEALQIAGSIGLFFSFTEILGIWLAMKYRNQKDPLANPDRYL